MSEVDQFIRECLASEWHSDARHDLSGAIAAGAVDWTTLVARARAQRLAPLLYPILRAQTGVPGDMLQALRSTYEQTARYNLFLSGELNRVLERCEPEGIPVLLLKGAALSRTVYRDPARRPLRDLDLLVRREHVPRVEDMLKASGYTAHRVETQPGAALEYENQRMYFKTAPMLSQIEIHWALIDSPFYQQTRTSDWFWQSAQSVPVGKLPALTLGAEAQTLYLCAHLVLHHGGADLLWLNDVAQVIRVYSQAIDWTDLLRHARELDLVLPLQTILPVVARDWAAPVPPEILAQVRALPVGPAEARVSSWLSARDRPPAQRFWHDLLSLTDWRQRYAFAVVNLFPSREYMQQRYHITDPRLVPLYYPYRWWLGIRRAVSGP